MPLDPAHLRGFVNVFLLANRLQALMDRSLTDLTAKQWVALIMLGTFDEPPLLGQLAERCGITHQSMMKLVQRLADKGYAVIARDPRDGRAWRIQATGRREQWALAYAERSQESIRALFADLSADELAAFVAAQDKIYARLGAMAAELS
jgi:DNA-binding MarR family transcriptional regulator